MAFFWKESYRVEIYKCDVCGHEESYEIDDDNPDPWGREHGESPPSKCPKCPEKKVG
jgi:hypothetical protein